MDAKKKKTINRLNTIKIALLTSVILILAVIAATVALSASNVKARSSALLFAEEYITGLTSEELCKTLSDYVSDNITEFESVDDVNKKISALIETEELSLFRHESYTKKNPTFTVCFGSEELFTLKLKANSFPIKNGYKVKELKVSDGISLGNDVILNLPARSVLTVNGITVERSRSDPDEYCDLSEFEASLSDSIKSDRYFLGRFFFAPDISVVYDGNRLGAGSIIDGAVHFHFPASMADTYTFNIPVGATLKVNGIKVTKDHLAESELKYSFITKYEENVSGAPTSSDYRITGLFSKPQVEVTYDGVALEEVNGSYKLPDGMTKSVVIAVPDYATLKINGVKVSSDSITKRKEELPILAGVTDYAKDRPYLTEYTVEGLFLDPKIEVTDENGAPLALDPLNSTESRTVYSCTLSDIPDNVKSSLENYVKAYAEYYYSGGSGIGDNFNSVTKYTPYYPLAYSSLKDLYKDLYSLPSYKELTYGEMTVESFIAFSESAYSAVITLPLEGALDGERVTLTLKMELLCTFSGSRRFINYRIIP